MSCPHVSGVVALMLSANPSATPAQVFSALETSSENPNTSGRDNDMGYGIVNALAAVEEILKYNGGDGNQNSPSNSNSSSSGGSNSDNSGRNNSSSNNTGSNSGSDCVELVITLKTDLRGSDTYHWLQSGSEYLFYEQSFASLQTYQQTACLDPRKCSAYNIRDRFGDGIRGEGVEIKYDGEVVYQGGDFGIVGVKYLGACA